MVTYRQCPQTQWCEYIYQYLIVLVVLCLFFFFDRINCTEEEYAKIFSTINGWVDSLLSMICSHWVTLSWIPVCFYFEMKPILTLCLLEIWYCHHKSCSDTCKSYEKWYPPLLAVCNISQHVAGSVWHEKCLLRLLLPGGDVDIETSQFTRASKILYNLALKVRHLPTGCWDELFGVFLVLWNQVA